MFKNRFFVWLVFASALLLVLAAGCSEDTPTEPADNNTNPVLGSIGAQTGYVSIQIEFGVSAADSASDTLAMTAVSLPTGATYTDNEDGTADFSWTPTTAGVDTVTFIASDGALADSEVVVFTIDEAIELSGYSDLIESIAPPAFSSGGGQFGSPLDTVAMDSIWHYGNWDEGEGEYCHALLEKVFGDSTCDEPFALYRNMMELDRAIEMINMGLEVGEDTVDMEEEGHNFHGVIEIEGITTPVAIPEECQAILGAGPIDLDYHLSFNIIELENMQLDAGFKVTDTDETILSFHSDVFEEDGPWNGFTESNLFWANHNLITDAIHIKCVFFKGLEDVKVMWGYEIQTIGSGDFQYKLTWYTNEMGVEEGYIGRIIGGGNNDVKFALRYQAFNMPDTTIPGQDITQVFVPPNYSNGGTDTTGFAVYIDEDNYYGYSDLPTALLDNPLADPADLINPWDEK